MSRAKASESQRVNRNFVCRGIGPWHRANEWVHDSRLRPRHQHVHRRDFRGGIRRDRGDQPNGARRRLHGGGLCAGHRRCRAGIPAALPDRSHAGGGQHLCRIPARAQFLPHRHLAPLSRANAARRDDRDLGEYAAVGAACLFATLWVARARHDLSIFLLPDAGAGGGRHPAVGTAPGARPAADGDAVRRGAAVPGETRNRHAGWNRRGAAGLYGDNLCRDFAVDGRGDAGRGGNGAAARDDPRCDRRDDRAVRNRPTVERAQPARLRTAWGIGAGGRYTRRSRRRGPRSFQADQRQLRPCGGRRRDRPFCRSVAGRGARGGYRRTRRRRGICGAAARCAAVRRSALCRNGARPLCGAAASGARRRSLFHRVVRRRAGGARRHAA